VDLGPRLDVKTPVFEGPLELLLALVEREELDIFQVSLAKVTDAYLAEVAAREVANPQEMAEFLWMAARLLLLKSIRLLPGEPATEEETDLLGWEEDVRRCHEVHKMPGLRIYPGYQPFDLDHSAMENLVKMTAARGLILQVVFGMEDPRVHHPIITVGPVTFAPLLKAVQSTPNAKVQLLHFPGSSQGQDLARFMTEPNTVMDISRLEGNGAVQQPQI